MKALTILICLAVVAVTTSGCANRRCSDWPRTCIIT